MIHSCYPAQRPVKELSRVNYIINMEYEEGRPLEAETALSRLLGQESLVVRKKSKKAKAGFTEVDLIPLIYSWNLEVQRDTMTLDAVLAAQNPGLSPELIRAAFLRDLPRSPAGFRHLPPPGGAGRRGKGVPLTGV